MLWPGDSWGSRVATLTPVCPAVIKFSHRRSRGKYEKSSSCIGGRHKRVEREAAREWRGAMARLRGWGKGTEHKSLLPAVARHAWLGGGKTSDQSETTVGVSSLGSHFIAAKLPQQSCCFTAHEFLQSSGGQGGGEAGGRGWGSSAGARNERYRRRLSDVGRGGETVGWGMSYTQFPRGFGTT